MSERHTRSYVGALLSLLLLVTAGIASAGAATAVPVGEVSAGAKVIVLSPTQSSFVSSSAPNRLHSMVDRLVVTSSTYTGYLTFDTSKIGAGYRVDSASLSLSTVESVATRPGLVVKQAGNGWAASSLTYQNRPPTGAVLNTPVFASKGSRVTTPLSPTGSVNPGGLTSFALNYTEPASGTMFAKAGSGAPRLEIVAVPSATTPPPPPATPPPPVVSDSPLAFNPSGAHQPKVFAHYFTPYPISIDNKDGVNDYYARNYLNPYGESSAHLAFGGLLRDRPIARAPLAGDWQAQDVRTEINQARAAGIDGFFVDLLSLSGTHWERTTRVMDQAAAEGRGFVVVPQLDMTTSAGKASASETAAKLASLASKPSQFRLSDGRAVISAFKAENQSVAWWKTVLQTMKSSYGVNVAFSPVFLNAPANMAAFAPISYAVGEWGVRTPGTVAAAGGRSAAAHKLGVKWIAPVAVQDVRPNQGVFWEAGNLETFRATWERAIDEQADFVQIATWNDYSESTSVAPSMAHGWSFADVNAYYSDYFAAGRAPTVVRDVLYLTHRKQLVSAKPQISHRLMVPADSGGVTTAPRNTVEVMSMLTSAAQVTVTVGGVATTYTAPAGVSSKTVPLRTGQVLASATRNGKAIARITSPTAVVASPEVQDLQYFGYSSAR